MNRPTHEQHAAAREMFVAARGPDDTADASLAALRALHARFTERLRPLVGAAGVEALVARGIRLTASEYASVAGARTVEEVADRLRGDEPIVVDGAATHVVAHILALLESLVGERLTRQVLRDADRGTPDADKETEE